jgi:hypothetical protein
MNTKLIRFDWAMKSLLRDKANFDILEGFLSAILRQDVSVIKILVRSSNVPDIDLKLNRVDILIQDKQQQYVIVEIQNCHISAYVVSISILYFDLGQGKDYVFYVWQHGVSGFARQ